eukprot:6228791-Amphidinium_carterae.1
MARLRAGLWSTCSHKCVIALGSATSILLRLLARCGWKFGGTTFSLVARLPLNHFRCARCFRPTDGDDDSDTSMAPVGGQLTNVLSLGSPSCQK